MIFIGYIVIADGDQFTTEHYMITGLSTIPFVFVQLLKALMSDVSNEWRSLAIRERTPLQKA